jgi:hypothetical protein
MREPANYWASRRRFECNIIIQKEIGIVSPNFLSPNFQISLNGSDNNVQIDCNIDRLPEVVNV